MGFRKNVLDRIGSIEYRVDKLEARQRAAEEGFLDLKNRLITLEDEVAIVGTNWYSNLSPVAIDFNLDYAGYVLPRTIVCPGNRIVVFYYSSQTAKIIELKSGSTLWSQSYTGFSFLPAFLNRFGDSVAYAVVRNASGAGSLDLVSVDLSTFEHTVLDTVTPADSTVGGAALDYYNGVIYWAYRVVTTTYQYAPVYVRKYTIATETAEAVFTSAQSYYGMGYSITVDGTYLGIRFITSTLPYTYAYVRFTLADGTAEIIEGPLAAASLIGMSGLECKGYYIGSATWGGDMDIYLRTLDGSFAAIIAEGISYGAPGLIIVDAASDPMKAVFITKENTGNPYCKFLEISSAGVVTVKRTASSIPGSTYFTPHLNGTGANNMLCIRSPNEAASSSTPISILSRGTANLLCNYTFEDSKAEVT